MHTKRITRGVALATFPLVLGLALGGAASARSELAFPAAEHWDGTSWTSVAVPSNGASLNAVVAPAANDVWAFGISSVAEHRNGTTWRGVELAIPKDSAAPEFYGAGNCLSRRRVGRSATSRRSARRHSRDHRALERPALEARARPADALRASTGSIALSADNAWAVGQASVSDPEGISSSSRSRSTGTARSGSKFRPRILRRPRLPPSPSTTLSPPSPGSSPQNVSGPSASTTSGQNRHPRVPRARAPLERQPLDAGSESRPGGPRT